MSGKPQYTAAQFIEAVPGSGGLISVIAAKIGCSWQTAKKYIETMPTIKTVYDDECAKVDDLAVKTVIDSMRGGDVGTAKWWLAKKRREEFGDNLDITTGGKKITIIEIVRNEAPD